jgi:deazaflavin-dependent oxidoreductase (nitroreductase family)
MAGPPAIAKRFNRTVALPLAGHRFLPTWVVLTHRGRRSGKAYTVPLAVIPTGTSFVIALPWGRETDWVRNVRAAGRCTVRWKGADYECTEPRFVGTEVALAAAHGLTRQVLRRKKFPHGFIELSRRAAA